MSAKIVRFGPFTFDHDRGTLFRDDMLVPVGQRGAALLKALLDRPGDVLTKKELMDAAWPGLAIEEGNLRSSSPRCASFSSLRPATRTSGSQLFPASAINSSAR